MNARRCVFAFGLASLLVSSLASAEPQRRATLPSVSPDGKHVAYVHEFSHDSSEVRIVGMDGRGDRVLVREGGVLGWTEQGRRVTWVNSGHGPGSLSSVALDGGDPQTIARLEAKSLSLSHDGLRLAFTVGGWTASRLMVGDRDGRNARSLTDSTGGWFNLAWSPDDRMIAVTHLDSTRDLQVWLIDSRDGHSRPLTHFVAADGGPQWPTWSPDGKRIAIQAGKYDREHHEKDESDIWVIDVASGQAKRISQRSAVWLDETPSWCPDGKHIVFQSTRTGAFQLWVMKDNGTGARQITR